MEAGAALDEAMDALAQKNEDLTEDVQTFAKALDGLGEPLADAKAERRRLETIRAEYQSQRETTYCGRWPPTNRCQVMSSVRFWKLLKLEEESWTP